MITRYPVLIYLLLNACIGLQAQHHFVFSSIDTRTGLSENRIRNFIQLPDGRMLIFTEGITNIYDGTTFHYLHEEQPGYRLSGYSGFLHGYADNDFVWIKKGEYFALIDIRKEKYVDRPDSLLKAMGVSEPVADFFIDKYKNRWILTTTGLYLVEAGNSRKRLFRPKGSVLTGHKDELSDVAVNHWGKAFLCYKSGRIEGCDLKTGRQLFSVNSLTGDDRRYQNSMLTTISGNRLFLTRNSTDGKGVVICLDTDKRTVLPVLHTDYWLNTPTVDKQGNLWVSCRDGLWFIDKSLQRRQFVSSFRMSDGTTISGEISAQCHDDQGGLWIGTYNRGMLYYHPDRFKFRKIGLDAFGSGVKGAEITCFSENGNGGLWVGTSQGMFSYNRETGQLSRVAGIPADAACISIPHNRFGQWLCTSNRGLYRLEASGVKRYNTPLTVRHICELSGRLYVAANDGFGRLNPANGVIERISWPGNLASQHYVYELLKLDARRLLLRGDFGLLIYNTQSHRYDTQLNRLLQSGNRQYNCFVRDRRGLVWIGSQDGLKIWDPVTNRIRKLYTDDGLVNNSVKGVLEDREGRMWVSTSGGISCINVSGRTDGLHFTFSNFNHYDGTLENEFTSGSISLDSHNLLMAGGVNGFNTVDLSRPLALLTRLPNPLFTNLFLFGERIRPDVSYDGNPILSQSITSTKHLVLNHDQNFISIGFSALNYVNPTQTYFRYRLDGVDEEWREVPAQNGTGMATYTNLSPGTYRLQVKSANNSKVWTDGYSEITIEVKPPFWRTPLAYLIYLILSVVSANLALRYYRRITNRRMMRRNEEELNRMKFNFFTNISHEFRTPLTLIITPLEAWMKEVRDNSTEHRLLGIYRHARDLQNLVNQLLDFRRLEVTGEKLTLTFGNIVDFVMQFEELFDRLAREKKITFSVTCETEELYCYFDREKIYRIFNNLLSNAFKFTPEEGRIDVHLERIIEEREYLEIRVSDTGKGIAGEELSDIFNRFYQASGAEEGSGIGLHLVKEYVELHSGRITVESELGKGTIFRLMLPTDLAVPHTEGTVPDEAELAKSEITEAAVDKMHKLLVVEDNAELRSFLVGELSKSYDVLEAPDGLTGLTLAKDILPDLIISDVMMPGMNGLELCNRLKSDLQTSHIPVILLTARTSDEHKLEGYRAGADEYLPKPFNLDILHLRISKLIAKQQERRKEFKQKLKVNPKEITITSLDEKLIEKALSFIERNMDNPEYSVQQFSEEMGMERTALYKKLQGITGLAPSEFIRSIRLKRAAQLLLQGQLSVGEVADRVGFGSRKYFSKSFREMFGKSPSEYSNRQDSSGEEDVG